MFILQSQLVEDFQELQKTLETMNLFNANLGFFFLHFTQILILEALAWGNSVAFWQWLTCHNIHFLSSHGCSGK